MVRVSGGSQKPLERVMIFVDGNYLRRLFKEFFDDDNIDFFKMRNSLLTWYDSIPTNPSKANLIRTYYYDGIAETEPEHTEHKKYFDSLKRRFFFLDVRLGDAVKTADGTFRQKGVDILMAIDALTMAYRNYYESGLFVLGDRDFIPLIRAVKDAGKKTFLFSYIEKVPKELDWEFDFRLAFSKEKMEQWHIKKQSQ